MLEVRRVGVQHFADARQLGGRLGGGLGVVAGDEDVDVATQRLGRGDGFAGRGLQRAVGVIGQQENGHYSTPASALSFCTSSATLPTLTPALRLAGSEIFSTLRRGVDVDAELLRLLDVERLLLGLHDVGQRGIARLVEAQVGGDDRRQLEAHGFEAAVDLARDHGVAVVDRQLGSEGALRPAEQRGEHLARLIAIVVNGLLAEDDEVGLLRLDDALEDLRNRERLDGHVRRLDEDAAVGADGESGADRLLRLCRPHGHDDDFRAAAFFLDADRLFDGDLTEGVHRHLHVGKIDARTVRLDANFDVVINDPLDRHQYLHAVGSPSALCCGLLTLRGCCAARRELAELREKVPGRRPSLHYSQVRDENLRA